MRRLGEEIYGSRSTIQHKTSSSDVGSVCDQSLDGQFFRSTDIHVRFLSTLIILRTINQGMHLCLSVFFSLSVSILTAIFPGVPALAGTRMSPFWILLKLRMMEVVVTTGAMRDAKLQSNRHHQQTKLYIYIYNSFCELQRIHRALSFFVGYPIPMSVFCG